MAATKTRVRSFRDFLALQALAGSTTAGTRGQSQQTMQTIASVYGNVEDLTGRELVQAREIIATATHSVETHYNSAIAPKARFLWGDIPLNIEAVLNPDGRGRFMRVLCTREVTP